MSDASVKLEDIAHATGGAVEHIVMARAIMDLRRRLDAHDRGGKGEGNYMGADRGLPHPLDEVMKPLPVEGGKAKGPDQKHLDKLVDEVMSLGRDGRREAVRAKIEHALKIASTTEIRVVDPASPEGIEILASSAFAEAVEQAAAKPPAAGESVAESVGMQIAKSNLRCHNVSSVAGLHGFVNVQFFGKSFTVIGGEAGAIESTGRVTIASAIDHALSRPAVTREQIIKVIAMGWYGIETDEVFARYDHRREFIVKTADAILALFQGAKA